MTGAVMLWSNVTAELTGNGPATNQSNNKTTENKSQMRFEWQPVTEKSQPLYLCVTGSWVCLVVWSLRYIFRKRDTMELWCDCQQSDQLSNAEDAAWTYAILNNNRASVVAIFAVRRFVAQQADNHMKSEEQTVLSDGWAVKYKTKESIKKKITIKSHLKTGGGGPR